MMVMMVRETTSPFLIRVVLGHDICHDHFHGQGQGQGHDEHGLGDQSRFYDILCPIVQLGQFVK